jgi:uncharacterized protein with GYD domain
MARYLQLAKYTQQACAAVFEEGFVARRKVLETYVAGLGGTLVDMYGVADDDWDFVAIIDSDDFSFQKIAAHLLRAYGSGAIERSALLHLATLEEVDAARASLPGYTPPGR